MADQTVSDQADAQSTQDQAQAAAAQGSEQPEEGSQERAPAEHMINIDGEEVPLSKVTEWKKGYMRQDDYTKKTQALAAEKRSLARGTDAVPVPSKGGEIDPEVAKAAEVLKQAGFVTQADLEAVKAQQEDERQLQDLLSANPDLKAKEKAIRAIGKTSKLAWEDIINDYGFKERKSISRSTEIKGQPSTPKREEPKKVSDMTDKEYQEWRKSNMKGSMWKRGGSIR